MSEPHDQDHDDHHHPAPPSPLYAAPGRSGNPRFVSRWSGVATCSWLAGIEPETVLAIGDGDNDVAVLPPAVAAVA